ncbi:MAG: hypothetical protein JSU65_06370 [Candidatus Zixiibacteriota bacterium]|nr:MAG: hypothetical protein JSU65_06370 [candidate division Zixibacteria bacterium]
MKDDRLYYTDSGLLTFNGTVVETGGTGEHFYTILDQTAFYPTSGGQLHDTGTLGDVRVIDVVESEDGRIRHITSETAGAVGQTVRGEVDADRRWQNRQMHTVQHLLSASFIHHCDAETVSVHLGEEYGAVELDTANVTEAQLRAVEHHVNDLVRQNIPVKIQFAEGDEIETLPLRKVPTKQGVLRIIRIADIDCSACGGTHCDSTAQVGLVKIIGQEKLRGHQLVKFLSGSQLHTDYGLRLKVTDRLARTLTCSVGDLNTRIEGLAAEHKSMRREIANLQKELLPARIEKLSNDVKQINGIPVVSADISEVDTSLANNLASQLAHNIKGVAVLFSRGRLIVASGCSTVHAGEIIKRLVQQTGLKGGGSGEVAQVGAVTSGQWQDYARMLEGMVSDG